MTLEVLRALFTLVRFCEKQENCKSCPMKEICGRMPCEL